MATRKKRAKKQPVNQYGIINKDEIFLMVTSLSNERGIAEETIFQAIESALANVAEKHYSDHHQHQAIRLRVAIDRDSGECSVFRCWEVVDREELDKQVATQESHAQAQVQAPAAKSGRRIDSERVDDADKVIAFDEEIHMDLQQAAEVDVDLKKGDLIEEPYEDVTFTGRIAAQYARQVIMQKVREAEREKIADQFLPRLHEMLMGTVKRVTRDSVILEIGRHIEGIILKSHLIGRENFRVSDRVRALLIEVRTEHRGPQLLLSRTDPQMLVELFKVEVPEIGEGVITVEAASRDPGVRAKIAVKTNDKRIDPIGACVGMRGARVQAVTNELNGERIDIVLWDDSPAQLVVNAMAPAEIESIVVNEDDHTMDLAVAEEFLSQAIGRGGQNVRLASELSGWKLNVMTSEQIGQKQTDEASSFVEDLMESLDIDSDFAEVLVAEGFQTTESVAYAPIEEMLNIEGFDEEIIGELQQRAREVIAKKEQLLQDKLAKVDEGDSLLAIEGMTTDIAAKLVAAEIVTREDLADQSVFDLTDLGVDQKLAGELIMAARASWFEDDKS